MDAHAKGKLRLSGTRWLWLFPVAYAVHIAEEFSGVGPGNDINLSRAQFLVLSGVALLLIVTGVVLAQRFGFPQLLAVCLGALFVVNGLSHTLSTISHHRYNAGVVSGILVFIPLGLITLISFKRSMNWLRFCVGVGLGLLIQGIVTVIAR
jgi:uncharacterized membrane protein HdeD (DUF308 family)